jgi:hypothetical protein
VCWILLDSLSPDYLHIRFVLYSYFFIGIAQSVQGRVIKLLVTPINLLLGLILRRPTFVLIRHTIFSFVRKIPVC